MTKLTQSNEFLHVSVLIKIIASLAKYFCVMLECDAASKKCHLDFFCCHSVHDNKVKGLAENDDVALFCSISE